MREAERGHQQLAISNPSINNSSSPHPLTYDITNPPSTSIACPVKYRASSDARNATTPAISHGCASLPSGQSAARIASHSSPLSPSRAPMICETRRTIPVSVLPGQTALAVTP